MNTVVMGVEDEAAIRELLRYSLTRAGFDAVMVESAEMGLSAIRHKLPDVLLLDVMLPGMSGIQMVQRLRGEPRTKSIPILMVTARADESDRIKGLDLGADDYITKPFSPNELIARIRAVLRRRAPHRAGERIEAGGICLDPVAHTVHCQGVLIELGLTEFDLLQFLLTHPNRVQSRDQLLNALRGDHRFLENRTVDVYIRRLRAGLGPMGESLIETVRGVGYKLNTQET